MLVVVKLSPELSLEQFHYPGKKPSIFSSCPSILPSSPALHLVICFLFLWISLFLDISYTWDHIRCDFVWLTLHIAYCFQVPSMLCADVLHFSSLQTSIPLYGFTAFVYPFIGSWASELFSLWGHYEKHSCEHLCIRFCVNLIFHVSWKMEEWNSGLYDKSVFNLLVIARLFSKIDVSFYITGNTFTVRKWIAL